MQDPSQGIQRELQPHVHLLSTYRFPQFPSLHPDKVAEWLVNAPKISRDQAPFYWTYLDRPADGTILLVWQSMSLGTDYPSDGYVWTPTETAYQFEVAGGYILEVFHQKSGYSVGESLATHTRRRYRLHPSRNPGHQGPTPDNSLWIVHYAQADPNDRVPASVIPVSLQTSQTMSIRAHLHSQGQIVQKEFMLHDRANWPQIAFPRGPARAPQMYSGTPSRVPQNMAYPPTQPGPPAKRARTQATAAAQAAVSGQPAILDVDDEEDTSRGDQFDHTTPREISMSRYKQNQEWMEEILSSPYAMSQIIPADLGLGVRGELGDITQGIFDAPYDPDKDIVKYNYVGKLDADKANEFRKRVNENVSQANNEMERMKAKHDRRMAKFKKGSLITMAEKELRNAVDNPSDTGPEYWRLEGRIEDDSDEEGKAIEKAAAKVSDIVAQVEASVGRHAQAVKDLLRIQDGGYEEALAVPSPRATGPSTQVTPPGSNNGSTHSGVLIGDADMEMGNSAANLLDQFHTGLSSTATPGSGFQTPQPNLQDSGAATPSLNAPSPHPAPQASTSIQRDVSMGEASGLKEHGPSNDATGAGDWVVVPPGGLSPSTDSAMPQVPVTGVSSTSTGPATTVSAAPPLTQPSPLPGTSNSNTPGLPDFSTSPNDFSDLGDLDTAGDALASYGEGMEGGMVGDGDLGDLEIDMDVGMDDSAFGDAFHGVESGEGEPGEGLGDGL